MALTEKATGQQTTTVTSEHQLGSDQTDDETHVLRIDANPFAAGEMFVLRGKTKTRSGSSSHTLEYEGRFLKAALDSPDVLSLAIPSVHSLQWTLTQLNGSSRNIDWSILAFGDAVQEKQSNDQTATPGSSHQLGTAETDDETYLLRVDASLLAAGERLELWADVKARSGSTIRQEHLGVWRGESILEPSLLSVPVPSTHEIEFFLKQTGGTGRVYPWSIIVL
jgi:hypothetical protein